MPGTTLGRWTVGLIAVMPILFVFGSSFSRSLYESVSAGRTILADIASRPVLALTMLAGMAAGISGFITGLLAIVKQLWQEGFPIRFAPPNPRSSGRWGTRR
jgi:hypothetical protein